MNCLGSLCPDAKLVGGLNAWSCGVGSLLPIEGASLVQLRHLRKRGYNWSSWFRNLEEAILRIILRPLTR